MGGLLCYWVRIHKCVGVPLSDCLTPYSAGRYRYSGDLAALHQCRSATPVRLLYSLDRIVTPLSWEAWLASLVHSPDHAFASWLITGIQGDFRIRYDYALGRPKSLRRNLASALEKPQVIWEYLEKDCVEGWIMGPFTTTELSQLHISRFGVVPKSTPGKWRLILGLPLPEGHSVNDGISEAHCSLLYVSIEDAVEAMFKKGWGVFLFAMPTGCCPFTQTIGGCWACVGRKHCT